MKGSNRSARQDRYRAYSVGMMRTLLTLCFVVNVAVMPSTAADPVQLTIHDGRVSLVATDVTVGQIFEEWARIGQTRIVNGDRVPGGRVTLELTNVPEQEALDILLRTAAGYIAVPRASGVADASRFDRILILPTTAAPAQAARPPAAAAPVFQPPVARPVPQAVEVEPGIQRLIGPDGQPVPDDQQDAPAASPRQPFVPLPPGFSEPADNVTKPPAPTSTTPPPPSATPTAPVGVPVPGMIVPVPRPENAEKPAPRVQ